MVNNPSLRPAIFHVRVPYMGGRLTTWMSSEVSKSLVSKVIQPQYMPIDV